MRFDWWAAPKGYPEDFGRTICLLGTAGQGPIRELVAVKIPEEAEAVFGTRGTLARAVRDVYNANPRATIVCYRVSGEYGTATWMAPASEDEPLNLVEALYLRGQSGGEQDNDIGVRLAIYPATDTEPGRAALLFLGKDGVLLKLYWLHDYPTMGQLVQAINMDAELGDSPCVAASGTPLVDSGLLTVFAGPGTVYLRGGVSDVDLDKDELFIALDDAYGKLLGRHFDVMIPLGAYLDDAYLADYYGTGEYSEAHYADPGDHLTLWDTEQDRPAMFHAQLVEFCRKQQSFGWMTHGVIGTRPLTDSLLDDQPSLYITQLITETAMKKRLGLTEGEGDGASDFGFHISIVAGDLLHDAGTPQEHWESGALAYAAMICGLDADLTTTNKPVPGKLRQRVEFDTDTLRELAHLGVVAFRTSVKQGLVVANGVTAGLPRTDMHLLSNLRMTQLTLCNLNGLLREFKGEDPKQLERSGEVDRQVNDLLDGFKEAKILKDYRFLFRFDHAKRSLLMNLTFLTRNSVEELGTSGELALMG